MGNRIQNELCVACGMPLMYPFNEYRTCTQCTEIIKKVQYETKQKHIDKHKPKTILHVKRDKIYLARRPLGEDV